MLSRVLLVVSLFLLIPVIAVAEQKMLVQPFKAPADSLMRNFEGVNFSVADFSGVNASGSSFTNSSLDYANLSLANFQNTNLTNTSFRLALIEFTDFSGAEGLTAEQLYQACLPNALQEDKLGVDDFNPREYHMPEDCVLWEHVPRG